MNLERAIDLLGINRTKNSDIENMVLALGLFTGLNTPEENERLAAGKFVLQNWAKYSSECNTKRDTHRTESMQ
jgi:hypothetical protein